MAVHESGTLLYDPIDAAVELAIYDVLTSPAAQEYVVQTKDELGTLGEARGKITLLRRFDLYNLTESYEDSIPGLHFPPGKQASVTRLPLLLSYSLSLSRRPFCSLYH